METKINNLDIDRVNDALDTEIRVEHHMTPEMHEEIVEFYKSALREQNSRLITVREQEIEQKLIRFEETISNTNKYFYPVSIGSFIAIVGFTLLFLLQGITGKIFGSTYYPMVASKVEQATGFNTLIWYLAYLTPAVFITIVLFIVIMKVITFIEDSRY